METMWSENVLAAGNLSKNRKKGNNPISQLCLIRSSACCFMSLQPSSLPDNLNTSKQALEQTFRFQGDVLQITADVCQTKPPAHCESQPSKDKLIWMIFSSMSHGHTSKDNHFMARGQIRRYSTHKEDFGKRFAFIPKHQAL